MNEFLNSQKNVLGISDFLKSANEYTKENFPDLDIDSLFTNAISGGINTNFWTSSILNFARKRSETSNSSYDNSFNSYYYSQHF